MQRFTGVSSLAGAAWPAAVFCATSFFSVAACFLIFCLLLACFTATDFFAFSSALIFFAAWIVSSLAASSASKDWFKKVFGMSEVMPKAAE